MHPYPTFSRHRKSSHVQSSSFFSILLIRRGPFVSPSRFLITLRFSFCFSNFISGSFFFSQLPSGVQIVCPKGLTLQREYPPAVGCPRSGCASRGAGDAPGRTTHAYDWKRTRETLRKDAMNELSV